MAKRGSVCNSVLDWWQTVLDESKDLIDDGIDRVRDDGDDEAVAGDVAELQQAVAMLSAKLDTLVASGKPPAKPGA